MTDEKYLELYKKYKPKQWADIIGQDKIVASLKSAVRANKLPVAYLFSGPRGTGKTSSAKVLAAAINCINEETRTKGEACGQCEVCTNIYKDNQLGVNYISMANRGGVDEVRKIVDQARLAQPVRKTIWILDEVHNLSPAAWDSLLIPLESSSMPSLFILCSTEAHKIPDPIMSRVQARNFRLVSDRELKSFLETVSKNDGLDLSDEQIDSAVHMGRGSVRDSLTALESILSTGEFSDDLGEKLLLAIQSLNVIEFLKVVSEYSTTGEKFRFLAEDLYSDLRDLLILRAKGGEKLVEHSPVEDLAAFKEAITPQQHLALLEAVGRSVTDMSIGAAEHRIIFEAALLGAIQKLKRAKKAAV